MVGPILELCILEIWEIVKNWKYEVGTSDISEVNMRTPLTEKVNEIDYRERVNMHKF